MTRTSARARHPRGLSDSSLSALWRKAVLGRHGHKCIICGGTGALECHHVIHRRYKMLRWYALNGVPVCHGVCHDKANLLGVSLLEEDEQSDLITNAQVTFKQFLTNRGTTEGEWRGAVKVALLAGLEGGEQ